MTPEETEQIISWTVRYLDGELDGTDADQLSAALENDLEARAIFDEVSQQAFALSDKTETEISLPAESVSLFQGWKSWAFASSGLAAALVITLIWLNRSPPPDELARVFTNETASLLLDESGELIRTLAPDSTTPVSAGQGFRLDSATAAAVIRFSDETVVSASGHAEVRVERSLAGGKRIVVKRGQIEADVARQPEGRPMVIATPTSEIEVLGTQLEVNANEDETLLTVNSGRVALTRGSDGARVEVSEGKQTRATHSAVEDLVVEAVPELPDRWEVTFESGLPDGWRCGKWVKDKSAVVAHPNLENGYNLYSIASENAWEMGKHSHFQIHSDSVLYLSYTMEKPGWFQVMLNTRTPPSSRGSGGNVFYDHTSDWNRNLVPGNFQTVRIPLGEFTEFKRRGSPVSDVSIDGLAVFGLYFSTSQKDLGLSIESIRVTREP